MESDPPVRRMFAIDHWSACAVVPHSPCGRSSPPGQAVVNGGRRDERPRDTPQSLPRPLVSSAQPTTAVQVVRPTAPSASTRSLRMPTERGRSPTPVGIQRAMAEQVMRVCQALPPFLLRGPRQRYSCRWGADVSCGNCGPQS